MKSDKSKEQDYFASSRPEMLPFIPPGARRILDIGCGAGTFGSHIKSRQPCEIWGIEIDVKQSRSASKALDKVIVGDAVERSVQLPEFFSTVLCAMTSLNTLSIPFRS